MPGDWQEEVHLTPCGTNPDGTVFLCGKVIWVKPLFETMDAPLESEDSPNLGWQQANDIDVHIPLTRLVAAMKQFGITVSYDEEELARRLGPPPESSEY